MFEGKKILLGITGSIAAYKSISLVRLLIKSGAEVKVIVTPAAKDFVSKLTLSTLSKNKVLEDMFDEDTWSNHVMLGRWADIMVIAPMSCNTLAKMANGICDNFLLATYFSCTCPVVVAPAMDEDMWKHPSTKANISTLNLYGNSVISVENGELASGLFGDGRMAEPENIIQFITDNFFLPKVLNNKKVLITAGPTYEAIDPVRFIGNHSSGKMGIAIANEMRRKGADVVLVLGPTNENSILSGIQIMHVKSADEMYEACMMHFESADITVMAAAVADYTPNEMGTKKIKKTAEHFHIAMKQTKDILKTLGERKRSNQVLVGFALETNNEKAFALEKLKKKNADMIVMNSLNDAGAGFGFDTNKITIFEKNGKEFNFETKLKKEVAKDIVDTIITLHYV